MTGHWHSGFCAQYVSKSQWAQPASAEPASERRRCTILGASSVALIVFMEAHTAAGARGPGTLRANGLFGHVVEASRLEVGGSCTNRRVPPEAVTRHGAVNS